MLNVAAEQRRALPALSSFAQEGREITVRIEEETGNAGGSKSCPLPQPKPRQVSVQRPRHQTGKAMRFQWIL